MELKRKYIHMSGEAGRAVSQIALDEDYNVPDMKPDVKKVIAQRGEIAEDEVKVTTDHVWIRGRLIFHVLYLSEEDHLKSLRGELPFQENLSMDGVNEQEKVRLQWHLEDLSVSMIHSRKLGVRALVEVRAFVQRMREASLCYDMVPAEGEEIEVLRQKKEIAQLVDARHDTCRFRQEINLPSNKGNIQEILWKSMQLRNMEKMRKEGEIILSGEVLVFVLYEGEGDEHQLEWFETSVPVKGAVDCVGNMENGSFAVRLTPKEYNLDMKNDEDGEARGFQMDMVLDVQIQAYAISQEEYLADLYGLNCILKPEYRSEILNRIMVKNYAKTKAVDRLKLTEPEGIQQILNCVGDIEVDKISIREDGVEVEGTVNVQLICLTGSNLCPISLQRGFLPFKQKLEAPGIHDKCECILHTGMEQLNTILMENSQVEVKAVLDLELMVTEPQEVQVIQEVETQEMDLGMLQRIPGIVGYIAQKGECLWDIAKQNHTTVEKLMELNQISGEQLQGGEKILIVKSL